MCYAVANGQPDRCGALRAVDLNPRELAYLLSVRGVGLRPRDFTGALREKLADAQRTTPPSP